MADTLPIVEARNSLTSLPEKFAANPGMDALVVTRRGRPVLAILPWELYDSLLETMRIMADPQLMVDLREGIASIRAGETFDWESVKAEIGC
ncbi:MAG: type II toxin-antitoxin system Phd/YefM family antitoxin [Chloroflexota bacterium]|nr:type II toxin-antitoxin system Phd/YefM family antitoxin [Chloroflexota bacterium]